MARRSIDLVDRVRTPRVSVFSALLSLESPTRPCSRSGRHSLRLSIFGYILSVTRFDYLLAAPNFRGASHTRLSAAQIIMSHQKVFLELYLGTGSEASMI